MSIRLGGTLVASLEPASALGTLPTTHRNGLRAAEGPQSRFAGIHRNICKASSNQVAFELGGRSATDRIDGSSSACKLFTTQLFGEKA